MTINFSDPADRERHYRMVALVEETLALHRQLAAARTASGISWRRAALKNRRIEKTDIRIHLFQDHQNHIHYVAAVMI